MLYRSTLQRMVWFCVSVTIISFAVQPVLAATHEQIIESCKQALMPQIMACAQAKGLRGNHEAVRQQCGMGPVRACVLRAEQKQAAGKAAPAAPKEDSDVAPVGASAVQPIFVAPPRTIADITAILDSEKPDAAKIAQRKAEAEATPPANAAPSQLAQFYYDRANARALLAQNKDALADGLQALTVAKSGVDYQQMVRIRQFVGVAYRAAGDPKNAIAMFDQTVRDAEQGQHRGTLINTLANIERVYAQIGDVTQAGVYAGRVQALVQEARGSPNPKWRTAYVVYGRGWEADGDEAHGIVLQARGQYAEAEATFRRAAAFRRASLNDLPKYDFPPPPEQVLRSVDNDLSLVALNESKQGRLSEAEADSRRALLEFLQTSGKYSPASPRFIADLADILVEQGRYPEAEKLTRSALDVQGTLGIADDAPVRATILGHLGNILVLQRKAKDADAVYAELDKAIAQWPAQQREAFQINGSRVVALYAAGRVPEGIAAAEALVKRQTTLTGPNSYDTATARGTLALGYARAGRDADAVREFKAAIPILMTGARETSDEDDPTLVAARDNRLQRIVEAYISVLAHGTTASNEVAVETFSLADAVRGRAVEQSLADSSARATAKDPALAELVRKDQDLTKQISAELGTLNNLLALPSDQRGDQNPAAINAEITKLRADRKSAQDEIKRRFPAYADLVDPKPPTVDEIKATLRPGEALLSFYFGQDASFVWAVPKDGAVAFAAMPATQAQIATKVHALRESLEPQGSMVSDIAPFDLTLAYDLYATLLKPVEAGWKPAKSLIVVTNGALGELPLSLLPTAPSQVDAQASPPFSGYRNVPWLARTHAVTVIPSASALVMLRRSPPSSPNRERLIGFGDPYFNAQEEAEAEAEQSPAPQQVASNSPADGGPQNVMRGVPLRLRSSPHVEDVDKSELAMLPRLPDTREELTAMAHALDVDPAKALYLGKAANERNVETLDLSHYRIVAFATHGLVPGDIDGLTQPALALTAPDIAGVPGNGLLNMEKILALKLDADWVVLSACNTAAGAGAGAEAASGLGSAFFYAGSRALLVTNWSVQSASARELTTDIFRRQAVDPTLSRGEALRQAMMALLDGPGAVDASGQTVYTYAHPLFWAPYSVIGDGGGS
jgi:CHAT domain-containing protein/tetratricopeptide (TPR) repeat protein